MRDQRKRPKRTKGKLQERIEIVQDRADSDILPYVDKLIADLRSLPALDDISLLSQQDALSAIGTLDRTLAVLNNHLGVARSLKQLLETKRRTEER